MSDRFTRAPARVDEDFETVKAQRDAAWALLDEIASSLAYDAGRFTAEAATHVKDTAENIVAIGRASRCERMADRCVSLLNGQTDRVDRLAGLTLSLAEDLHGLIESSGGVYGLHQNGDVAPWDTLLRGGAFEDWLLSFDVLRDHLNGTPPAELARMQGFEPAELEPVEALRKVYDEDDVFAPAIVGPAQTFDPPPKKWDGRSSTLENEQALGVAEFARRQAEKQPAVVPDPEALGWLQQWVKTDILRSGGQVRPPEDLTGEGDLFTRAVVLEAYVAGRSQSWLLDRMGRAVALLQEGAELLRRYETHHRAKVGPLQSIVDADVSEESVNAALANIEATRNKAQVNADLAARFEAFLSHKEKPDADAA